MVARQRALRANEATAADTEHAHAVDPVLLADHAVAVTVVIPAVLDIATT